MNIGRHLGFLLKHNCVCNKTDTYVSFDSVEEPMIHRAPLFANQLGTEADDKIWRKFTYGFKIIQGCRRVKFREIVWRAMRVFSYEAAALENRQKGIRHLADAVHIGSESHLCLRSELSHPANPPLRPVKESNLFRRKLRKPAIHREAFTDIGFREIYLHGQVRPVVGP